MKQSYRVLPIMLLTATVACGQTTQPSEWELTQPTLQLPFQPDGVGVSADDDRLVFWSSDSSNVTFAVAELKAGKVTFSREMDESARKGAVLDAFIVSGKLVVIWKPAGGYQKSLTIHSLPDLKLLHTEPKFGTEVCQRKGHLYLVRDRDIAIVSLKTLEEVLTIPYTPRSNDLAFFNTRFGASVGGFVLDDSFKPITAVVSKIRNAGPFQIPDGQYSEGSQNVFDSRPDRNFQPPSVHYHDEKPRYLTGSSLQKGLAITAEVDRGKSAILVTSRQTGHPARRIALNPPLKSQQVGRGSLLTMTVNDLILVQEDRVFAHPVPDVVVPSEAMYVVPDHNRVVVQSDELSLKLRHRVHNAIEPYTLTLIWAGGRSSSDGLDLEWDTPAVKEYCLRALQQQFAHARTKTPDPLLWLADSSNHQPPQLKILRTSPTDLLVAVPVVILLESESGKTDRCRYLILQNLTREEVLKHIEQSDGGLYGRQPATDAEVRLRKLELQLSEVLKNQAELQKSIRQLEKAIQNQDKKP